MVALLVILVCVVIFGGGFAIDYAVNRASSRATSALADRRRRARHGHDLGEAPSSSLVRNGGQLPTLALRAVTALTAPDVLALLKSTVQQYSARGLLVGGDRSVTITGETERSFEVAVRSRTRTLLAFPVLVVAGVNGGATSVHVGGLSQVMYSQNSFSGFAVGAKEIVHWQTYLELLDRITESLHLSDPRSEASYSDGSVVNPGVAATRADAAPARSNILPSGERTCRRLNCIRRGIPVDLGTCVACEHPTVAMEDFRGDVMAAPGVRYDADFVPPETQADREPVAVPTPLPVGGELVCRRRNCSMRGVLVGTERCGSCEHPTVPVAEFRDRVLSAPSVPVV